VYSAERCTLAVKTRPRGSFYRPFSAAVLTLCLITNLSNIYYVMIGSDVMVVSSS